MAMSKPVRNVRLLLLAIFATFAIYKMYSSPPVVFREDDVLPKAQSQLQKGFQNVAEDREDPAFGEEPAENDVVRPVDDDGVFLGSMGKPNNTDKDYNTSLSLENATFVTLVRNFDIWEIAKSIREVEDRFNRKFHYPWVFINDEPFTDEFKKVTTALTSGPVEYGVTPREHWSFPEWIDQEKARSVREQMHHDKIIYGDSISYRNMCRYQSGFFYRHPLMAKYKYYWRVEPSVKMFCDVDYDVFKFMKDSGKKYSFVLSLFEYPETIKTLWDSVKGFMKTYPDHLDTNNSLQFISDDGGKTFNRCHFWSNFEIGSLDWLRSDAYRDYFDHLDKDGGFYYERWGDAPVHSIAAALLLAKDEIHFFNDIGYWHVPFFHCPIEEEFREKCHCSPQETLDWRPFSCTSRYLKINGLEKPAGWEKYSS